MMHPLKGMNCDINGNPFPATPMGRIAGRWPGNETDEQVEEALGMGNERKHITQPADWWEAFKAEADKQGVSLAEWLGEAGKAKLPPKVAKKLTERPPANRPKSSDDVVFDLCPKCNLPCGGRCK